jgi:hypothetical protein
MSQDGFQSMVADQFRKPQVAHSIRVASSNILFIVVNAREQTPLVFVTSRYSSLHTPSVLYRTSEPDIDKAIQLMWILRGVCFYATRHRLIAVARLPA